MWNEINTKEDLTQFLDEMGYFHDSCVKELHYYSGAYVKENLAMHPINDHRSLKVVIQRQWKTHSMIEMEFLELKGLRLFPADEGYTCEILDATVILKDGDVYWCDCGGLEETDLDTYAGTWIRASKLRWRSIKGHMGAEPFYKPDHMG
ncbi:MAG: hypothetical protein E7437_08930 [Ruminococcaceae bacterium]|nr:hypothetical protein [Oscillospiraceae bacterium]